MILKMKADTAGMISGSICLLHCMATPFLFFAKACADDCCVHAPVWWQLIDYLFIIVSFTAIYSATKNTTKKWMRFALWGAWGLLFLAIVNETMEMVILPETAVYIPALLIVGLHLYNKKYYTCRGNRRCSADS